MLVGVGITFVNFASASICFIYGFGMAALRYTSTSNHNLFILSWPWLEMINEQRINAKMVIIFVFLGVLYIEYYIKAKFDLSHL